MLLSEFHNLIKWNGKEKPFYEIYYLKLNDPTLGAALWLRYAIVSFVNEPPKASVWAMYFNSLQPHKNLALKETVSTAETIYRRGSFYLDIGGAVIDNSSANGGLRQGNNSITWDIKWQPSDKVYKHYPWPLYILPWPATKVVAPNLAVPANGWFSINGLKYEIRSTVLHQGHIWGRGYARQWAWANCGMFAEDKHACLPGRQAVLELLAKTSFGFGYLRTGREDMRFTIRGSSSPTLWNFEGQKFSTKVIGKIVTHPQNIIGVTYEGPSGEKRYCYNTKVADSLVDIYKKKKGKWSNVQRLTSVGTTAFETVGPSIVPNLKLDL